MRKKVLLLLSVFTAAAIFGLSWHVQAQNKAAGDKAISSGDAYEVYALKYAGPVVRKTAMAVYNTGWDVDAELYYYVFAIKGKNGDVTLVDASIGTKVATERKMPNYAAVEDLLAKLDCKPEQVKKVILTHLHFDHYGGMEYFAQLFPNAIFYVQKKEYDFWVKDPLALRPPFKGLRSAGGLKGLSELEGTKRLVMVDGDKVIGSGMKLILIPGHTPALQGVLLNTAKGPVIVASDGAHFARSFKEDMPGGLITDMLAWLRSYDKMRALVPVENIFPGHDPLLNTSYPKVNEFITKLAP